MQIRKNEINPELLYDTSCVFPQEVIKDDSYGSLIVRIGHDLAAKIPKSNNRSVLEKECSAAWMMLIHGVEIAEPVGVFEINCTLPGVDGYGGDKHAYVMRYTNGYDFSELSMFDHFRAILSAEKQMRTAQKHGYTLIHPDFRWNRSTRKSYLFDFSVR